MRDWRRRALPGANRDHLLALIPTMLRRLLLGASALVLAVFAYEGAVRALLRPLLDLPVITGGLHGRTLVLVLFSLTLLSTPWAGVTPWSSSG